MLIFVCIDFSVCFCLPVYVFMPVYQQMFVFVCVSVVACGSMSSGYTDTRAHTCPALAPCACSRMAFELGPEQSCALVDCHSSLNLLPDQSPPPQSRSFVPLASILSPTLTLDSKPDAGPPHHHGHTAWHFGERGREIVLRDRRDADGPVETRSLWSHKNERYGQTVHLLEWPSFWWSALVSGDFYCPGNGCLYIHGVYGQYNHVIPHNHIIRIMWPCSVIPPVGWVLQHDWHLKINLLVGCTHRN